MEAPAGPPRLPKLPTQPNIDKIKQRLIGKGVFPTPKIIHTLRKKQLQKSKRRIAKQSQTQTLTDSQKQEIAEETQFQTLKAEYRSFTKAIDAKDRNSGEVLMVGKPWERLERNGLRELAIESTEYAGEKLKEEHLRELSDIMEKERNKFAWLLDDDVELDEGLLEKRKRIWSPPKRTGGEVEAISFLVDKMSGTNLTVKDWKLSKMMKHSGLVFTEGQLLRLVEGLGRKGEWRHAISVVEWVYNLKEHKHYKSRFVYTKLLAVLGKARRPQEALQIFNLMRDDYHIYPDMAAYHSISVTLGQAGHLKELLNLIQSMRQKPSKRIKNLQHKNWDPVLEPDVVVFNAVLNACVPDHQWKGVYWVLEQMRKSGLKPNGPTYGLAMEVMMEAGKYELVHEFFGKMRRSGEAPKALTYKVLVRTFSKEGKVDEAVQVVRDMEKRGVIGIAAVYYELACCLCGNGRWREAMVEVEKLKKNPRTKPLAVTFTGMIMSSMDGGHFDDCISIFEHIKDRCALDIGIINAMLKVYGRNDMFLKAKELFEESKSLSPDVYTYRTMLETSASAFQWEYFEYVYKEMALSGYQLDQTKYAFLLVKASRAGKWHLLEHAFDRILEDGEIPNVSFFTELACQAIVQQDYDGFLSILNAMAYAPFQVSEKQWIDLFEKNEDRVSIDSLKELLEFLRNHESSSEATVTNLFRALDSLSRPRNLSEISSSIPSDTTKSSLHASIYDCDGNNKVASWTDLERLVDDVAFDESPDCFGDRFSNYSDDDDDDADLDGVDDVDESNLPSAKEILETWKENRSDNFFPVSV